MRCEGQLPSFDLLMVASRIYSTKIHVYFRAENPVVYQFKDFATVIHLQCISVVHFNPLVPLGNYNLPNYKNCSINTVESLEKVVAYNKPCDAVDVMDDVVSGQLIIQNNAIFCPHTDSQLPRVRVSIGDRDVCAVLDSGAQLSLVSASVLDVIGDSIPVDIIDGHVCDIIGFSGHRETVDRSIDFTFKIESFNLSVPHRFAVVNPELFPYCMLLGLDFVASV